MIKEVTIKLGGTKQAKRQYESIRADVEVTFTIPHENALNLEKTMDTYKYELRRTKVMFKDAMIAATQEIDGVPPAPPKPPKKEEKKEEVSFRKKREDIDEDKLFESLKDIVRKDYLNMKESDK
tara:strand:- start:381 stop:752 length:372 start_codon:yes stop_codon:yes gene_type:complete